MSLVQHWEIAPILRPLLRTRSSWSGATSAIVVTVWEAKVADGKYLSVLCSLSLSFFAFLIKIDLIQMFKCDLPNRQTTVKRQS